MCTIMTIDKKFFLENKNAVITQIRRDAVGNYDGYSILGMGTDSEEVTLVKTMDSEMLITMVIYLFEGNTERVWVHCRLATTSSRNVNACHGFDGGKYIIFHNGVLNRPESHAFNVDSQLIADDCNRLGLDRALENLKYDSYANIFAVHAGTGAYTVLRRTGGTLFTDGLGNYSTEKFSSITSEVARGAQFSHSGIIAPVHALVSSSYLGPYSSFRDSDDWEGLGTTGTGYTSDTENQVESLKYAQDLDTFCDLADYEDWCYYIPTAVIENMNPQQLQWAQELGILSIAPPARKVG